MWDPLLTSAAVEASNFKFGMQLGFWTSLQKQELSYRQQIARQLRTQFVEGISVTLKSTLRVIQCHWKRKQWTDHTGLTIGRVIGR